MLELRARLMGLRFDSKRDPGLSPNFDGSVKMDFDTSIGAVKSTMVCRVILSHPSVSPNKPNTPRRIDLLHGHKHLHRRLDRRQWISTVASVTKLRYLICTVRVAVRIGGSLG